MGEQAVDAGDHPWQRPAGEADGDEAGEGEGDGAGVVGPVGEQPEGDDDDGGLGGHRHAPADPLHAAPVLCAGLDVAGVGGVQADAQGSEPEQDERPDEEVLPVGEQAEADHRSGGVAGEHRVAPDRRRQAAVDQPEQEVQGDRRKQRGSEAQGDVPGQLGGPSRPWASIAAASVPTAR